MSDGHVIDRFRGTYEFLSNFYPARIELDGIVYYNAEAAYQAQKCAKAADRAQFARLYGDEAKALGRKVPLRRDWNEVKLPLMERIVREKFFANPHLARRLLATGAAELREGNPWRDTYWGVDFKTGEGENHLGRLLMALRGELAEGGFPPPDAPEESFGPVFGIGAAFADIASTGAECIVNSADSSLTETRGGVTGAIHMDAGPELLAECRTLGRCPAGEARLTRGYGLEAKYVVHTAAPGYAGDNARRDFIHNVGDLFDFAVRGESEFLFDDFFYGFAALCARTPAAENYPVIARCYWNALELSALSGASSVAVPVLGTGMLRFPKSLGAVMAVMGCAAWKRAHPESGMEITLVTQDIRIFDRLRQYLGYLSLLAAAEKAQ